MDVQGRVPLSSQQGLFDIHGSPSSSSHLCHLSFILFVPSGCVCVCVSGSVCPCMLMCIWITCARVCLRVSVQVAVKSYTEFAWGRHQWLSSAQCHLEAFKTTEDERTARWGGNERQKEMRRADERGKEGRMIGGKEKGKGGNSDFYKQLAGRNAHLDTLLWAKFSFSSIPLLAFHVLTSCVPPPLPCLFIPPYLSSHYSHMPSFSYSHVTFVNLTVLESFALPSFPPGFFFFFSPSPSSSFFWTSSPCCDLVSIQLSAVSGSRLVEQLQSCQQNK